MIGRGLRGCGGVQQKGQKANPIGDFFHGAAPSQLAFPTIALLSSANMTAS